MSNDRELWAPEPGDADYIEPTNHLADALSIVREMRERLGHERFIYSENLFLVATSEALGNLEHHLTKLEG